jgi:hypothetical protein
MNINPIRVIVLGLWWTIQDYYLFGFLKLQNTLLTYANHGGIHPATNSHPTFLKHHIYQMTKNERITQLISLQVGQRQQDIIMFWTYNVSRYTSWLENDLLICTDNSLSGQVFFVQIAEAINWQSAGALASIDCSEYPLESTKMLVIQVVLRSCKFGAVHRRYSWIVRRSSRGPGSIQGEAK